MINQNAIVTMCDRALDYINRRSEIVERFGYKYFVRAISDMLLAMGNYSNIEVVPGNCNNTSDFQELQNRFDSFMSKLGVTCNSNRVSDKIKAIKDFCEF